MGYAWPPKKKFNKYHAIRQGPHGSKLEKAVYQLLLLREKSGEIDDIRCQQTADLTCGIRWKVDFNFRDVKTGDRVWCEAKGVETERYRICLKLWKGGHGPGRLEIWKGDYHHPRCVDIVKP